MLASLDCVINFVEDAHKNQFRKYSSDPYHIHCFNVANIISGVTDDIEMIYSALLHDSIEDSYVTYGLLSRTFNQNIAKIVRGLTDFDCRLERSKYNRKERLSYYNDKLSRCDEKVHTIKIADIIDNLKDIEEQDPKFAKIYFAEKKIQLSVLTKGDEILYNRCKKIIDDYYKEK